MVAKSHVFGNPVVWDEKSSQWAWEDTKEPIEKRKKRCPQCSSLPTKEGHDPCIGEIPGAVSACCGHGIEDGYIVWEIKEEGAIKRFFKKLFSLRIKFE